MKNMNPCLIASRFTPDEAFDLLYHDIFPQVSDKNGVFKDQSHWWNLTESNPKESNPKDSKGSMIAFCTIGIVDSKTIFLYNVGVNPLHRRQGHGRSLLTQVFKHYPKHEIFLFVGHDNHAAINMYRKLQFVPALRSFVPPKGEFCMKKFN